MSTDLSPMGFRKTPFTRELAVAERFVLPHQAEATDALIETVRQRMSAALIAPAGTGKTVALRVLLDALPEARYQVRDVKVTGLSKRDLCREIAAACGLSTAGIFPSLVRKLQDAFCHTSGTNGLRPVILLDEAHDLRPESLAMLRLLTNFEMDSRLVLSLVLAGQPPLRTMLAERTKRPWLSGSPTTRPSDCCPATRPTPTSRIGVSSPVPRSTLSMAMRSRPSSR